MNKFIEFTTYPEEESIYINVEHIVSFSKDTTRGCSVIETLSSNYAVKEDVGEKIAKKMQRNYIGA